MGILFKSMTDEHIPIVEKWFQDAETKKRIGISDLRKWFDHVMHNDHYFVEMAYLDGTPIGLVMMEVYENSTAAISYIIGAQFRSQGYSKLMVQTALTSINLDHIVTFTASVEPDNVRSIRCLESLGFICQNYKPDEDNLIHFTWYRNNH